MRASSAGWHSVFSPPLLTIHRPQSDPPRSTMIHRPRILTAEMDRFQLLFPPENDPFLFQRSILSGRPTSGLYTYCTHSLLGGFCAGHSRSGTQATNRSSCWCPRLPDLRPGARRGARPGSHPSLGPGVRLGGRTGRPKDKQPRDGTRRQNEPPKKLRHN